LTGKIITVTLKDEVFQVHERVLCKNSKFFQRKLSEGQTSISVDRGVLSHKGSIPAFKMYLGWLYAKKIEQPTHGVSFAFAYVLAQYIKDRPFQQTVLDNFIERYSHPSKFPIPAVFQILYAGTPAGTPARRFLVDLCASRSHPPDELSTLIGSMGEGMKTDLLFVLFHLRPVPYDYKKGFPVDCALYQVPEMDDEEEESATTKTKRAQPRLSNKSRAYFPTVSRKKTLLMVLDASFASLASCRYCRTFRSRQHSDGVGIVYFGLRKGEEEKRYPK
jgi:hypothetical protein